jgi:aminotransferase
MDYDNKLCTQIRDLPRSGIRDFFELVIGRTDVISLGVGEPDKPTPWPIREAVIRSLEKGQTSYTSNLGLESLRIAHQRVRDEAVPRHLRSEDGDPRHRRRQRGARHRLPRRFESWRRSHLSRALLRELLPSIKMAYGVPVVVQTREENNSPSWPPMWKSHHAEDQDHRAELPHESHRRHHAARGAGKDRRTRREARFVRLHRRDLQRAALRRTQHKSIVEYPGMRERTVLLHGFSKAFAMTGWRLGYACAPAPLREAMMKIHQYCMLCAPIMSQMAGIEALKMGASAYEEMRQSYEQRRNIIVSRLNGMGLHCFNPGGAFYVFPDIRSTGLTSKEFAFGFWKRRASPSSLAAPSAEAGEGFVRCCYATAPELIAKAMDFMEEFVNEVRK